MKKIITYILILTIITAITPTIVYAAKKPITDEQTICGYVNIDWWQNLNDAYLTEYITKALKYNQDLKIATLKVEETTEQKNLTRANEMPSLGIGAVPALYKLPNSTSSDGLISVPLYANYELDLFGKNRDKTKSMDKLIEITRENERSAYISVVSAVGTTYYNIVKLDKLIEIQEQIIQDRKKIYELMKLSNEEGLISTADTVSAQKAYIKSNSDMIELKKARERMLNMLAVLTGDSPENSTNYERISFDNLNINKNIPDYIETDVITSRPDYVSAEKMLAKTGLDVRAAKKEFLPTFNILGLISFNSTDFLRKMNWKNSVALLGANAMLPLFTGGSKIANFKLNKNKYKQAIENYQKTNLTAIQEVNDALCDLKLDNQKYEKTLESYNAEQKDFYFTQLKYKEGVISNLDLLQKKEAILTTEKLVTSDKTAFFIDQIGLYKATAGKI
ncbi:TolC family protein [bacterium]|nr:TolC family protein [bacterium]